MAIEKKWPSDYYLGVPGKSMDDAQRNFFKSLAEIAEADFDHPVIVNVGVLLGCSMACFRAGSPSARLFGVDIDFISRSPGKKDREYIRASYIKGNSNEVHKQFKEPIHLLFIDSCHSYGSVIGDIKGWVPKVVAGGIVSFHDCHMGGVQKALKEWIESWNTPWEEIEGPCLGIRTYMVA